MTKAHSLLPAISFTAVSSDSDMQSSSQRVPIGSPFIEVSLRLDVVKRRISCVTMCSAACCEWCYCSQTVRRASYLLFTVEYTVDSRTERLAVEVH